MLSARGEELAADVDDALDVAKRADGAGDGGSGLHWGGGGFGDEGWGGKWDGGSGGTAG